MPDNKRLGVAVLAAGSSQRFGEQDKLTAPFCGKPLGLHVVDTLPRECFSQLWVIAASSDHPLAEQWIDRDFRVHANSQAQAGMGTSVALAAKLAIEADLDALLVALADMPLVPEVHFRALVDAAWSDNDLIGSCAQGGRAMPPAIFGATHFDALAELKGDQGARFLLREAATIECPQRWLIDIDTPQVLAKIAAGQD